MTPPKPLTSEEAKDPVKVNAYRFDMSIYNVKKPARLRLKYDENEKSCTSLKAAFPRWKTPEQLDYWGEGVSMILYKVPRLLARQPWYRMGELNHQNIMFNYDLLFHTCDKCGSFKIKDQRQGQLWEHIAESKNSGNGQNSMQMSDGLAPKNYIKN